MLVDHLKLRKSLSTTISTPGHASYPGWIKNDWDHRLHICALELNKTYGGFWYGSNLQFVKNPLSFPLHKQYFDFLSCLAKNSGLPVSKQEDVVLNEYYDCTNEAYAALIKCQKNMGTKSLEDCGSKNVSKWASVTVLRILSSPRPC